MSIAAKDLVKQFGSYRAIDGVSFEVPSGQLVALLGPSGSGKSTILRIVAGLESADSGTIELAGEDATGLPVRRRGIGFVFQHYALFRRMTIRENIAFGLEIRKMRKPEVRARVDELLDLIQLRGHADRYPTQLSGGQRQRVALARALAPRPRILLLDEPFGALDAKVRDELRSWLRVLHDQVHVTTLFVTHDRRDAFEVADRIVIVDRGRVEQVGRPQELYERPRSPFVTEFLGQVNVLHGRSVGGMAVVGEGMLIPAGVPGPDGPVSVYVRPHDLEVRRQRTGHPSWPARVERLLPIGGTVRLALALLDGTGLDVELTRDRCQELGLIRGDDVYVFPRDLKVFPSPGPVMAGI